MTSTHEALVRRPLDEVRHRLHEADRVLSGLPGGVLARDDEGASGSLRLKLGTLQITYRVTIRATATDSIPHAATVAVAGKEARGAGTLAATVDVEAHPADEGTLLRATLDLTATGRGESVPDQAWTQAADTLLAGVARALAEPDTDPRPEPADPSGVAAALEPAVSPAPRPVPLLQAAPPMAAAVPGARSTSSSTRWVAAAAALLVAVLGVLRRRRRRR